MNKPSYARPSAGGGRGALRLPGKKLASLLAAVAFVAAVTMLSHDTRAAEEPPAGPLWVEMITDPDDPHFGVVDLVGLAAADLDRLRALDAGEESWSEWFGVYVVPPEGEMSDETPAMLGAYEVLDERIRFTPRFPPKPGLSFEVQVDAERLAMALEAEPDRYASLSRRYETVAGAVAPSTRVTRIAPSGDSVPANLLRTYVYFTAPMRGGDAYERIYLADEDGYRIEQGFVDTGVELWDPTRTRLTLFLHPGRVKRGLEMRERMGPVLVEGTSVQVVVEEAMLDARGAPLTKGVRRSYAVTAEDRESPDPESWDVLPPPAVRGNALTILFPEPLDRALLEWMIDVETADGKPVPGHVRIGRDELSWEYVPHQTWTDRMYQIRIHPKLEDVAGNRVDGLFDVEADSALEAAAPAPPANDEAPDSVEPGAVYLTFRPR